MTNFAEYDIELPPIGVAEVKGIFEATSDAYPTLIGIGSTEDEAIEDFFDLLPDKVFEPTVH